MAGMPAARKPASAGLVDYLNSQAPRLDVSNSLAISSYFRALDSLLTQIALYRSERNEEQLYVMLLRYISMVVDTIKKHKDFNSSAPEYVAAYKRAPEFISECERLKVSLLAKDVQQPKAHTYNRPAEAVRIDDSGNNAQGTSECYSDATA